MTHYAERDIMELDEDGDYYCRHVQAMTAEELHCKSDIAAELAYRDSEIDRLTWELASSRVLLGVAGEHIIELTSQLELVDDMINNNPH